MQLSIERFWQLAAQSRLLTPQQCQQLAQQYAATASSNGSAEALSRWLVSRRIISAYQATVLLADQPGPFYYGEYQVYDRFVPSGHQATLFRAVHQPTRHPVCLYFLTAEAVAQPAIFDELVRRGAAAARVRSPFVLASYGLEDVGAYKFLVMENLRGQSLLERLAGGSLPPADAVRIAWQLARGLADLYAAGLEHGEVRADNVWLDPQGHALLLHFPLWRPAPWEAATGSRSSPVVLQAAAEYLAPERWQGAAVDARSDVYALACLLYRMIAGHAPFQGNDVRQQRQAHLQRTAPLLSQVRPGVPEPLAQVVQFALAKDPSQRYQRPEHFAAALAAFVPASAVAAVPVLPATAEAFLASRLARLAVVPAATSMPLGGAGGLGGATPVPAGLAAAMPDAAAWATVAGGTAAGAALPQAAASVPEVSASVAQGMPIPATPGVPSGVGVVSATPAGVGADLPVDLPVAADSPTSRIGSRGAGRWSRRKKQQALVVGGTLATLLVVLLLVFNSGEEEPAPAANNTNPAVTPTLDGQPGAASTNVGQQPSTQPIMPPGSGSTPGSAAEVVASVDGEPFWASPTSGRPIDTRFLPTGCDAVVCLRPAALAGHPVSARLLALPGPGGLGKYIHSAVQQLTGFAPSEVRRLVVGLYPSGADQPPRAVFVAEVSVALSAEVLQQRLPGLAASQLGEATVYTRDGYGYYLPPDRSGLLVGAPAVPWAAGQEERSLLEEALAYRNQGPTLGLYMDALLQSSDSDRHATVVFSQAFPFGTGNAMWLGMLSALRNPVAQFLGDRARAAALSAHLGETQDYLFLELRVLGDASTTPLILAKELLAEVQALPSHIDQFLLQIEPSPYSARILRTKLPLMVRELVYHTQAGSSEKQALLRCYLPSVAATNFEFATRLALVEYSGLGGDDTSTGASPPPADEPKTAAEILARKVTSLSFPRDTLEQSLKMLGEMIGIDVVILGSDLQLEGITKNQSFGLDERDKPAGQILRTILRKANPDGKLIYVIKKEGDKEVIYITTRAAAASRKDPIPPELQTP
jgi:serine/threonine-protein kinase